ncbi:MAG: acyl carrier protein [Nitrospinae bacterium]|nr:acyl carrier protein [Nitrospinota bacterium]
MPTNNKQDILQLIHSAVDEVNESLSEERRLGKSNDTILLGETGSLDSLGLINFIVAVENRAEKTLGLNLNLGEAMTDPETPLKTIDSLADFIIEKKEGQTG